MNIKKANYGSYVYYPCKTKTDKNIVFIHGYATTSEYHDEFVEHATNHYNYYAIQLFGHGYEEYKKDIKKHKIDMNEYVDYCVNLIKELNIGNFYLIGHSMGGGLSIRVANKLSDHVIALVSTTPMNSHLPISSIFNYFKFNPKTFKQTLKLNNILYHDFVKTVGMENTELLTNKEMNYQIKNREFLLKLKKTMFSLKNIKQCRIEENNLKTKTLVIAGKYDKLISPNSLKKMVKKINNNDVKLMIFENSAHLPFQEESSKYAQVILDFFKAN